MRSLALLVALSTAACGGTTAAPPRSDARDPAVPPADAAIPASADAPIAGAVTVAEPAEEPLPYALLAIDGSDAVLAVSQSADDDTAYLQRLDGATGELDRPVALPGHFVGAAWATGTTTTLLTAHGSELCLVELADGRAGTPRCERPWADVVVRSGDRFLALALDLPLPDPDAPPPPPPPRTKKPKKRPSKRERDVNTEATAPARRALALLGHWWGDERRPAKTEPPDEDRGDPFDTGIAVEEPMAGLGLVGAGVRRLRDGTPRIDVVFHEWVGPTRDRGSRALGRARLGVASLDGEGTLVEGSRGHTGETDLFFGFLAGVVDPRLVTTPAGTVVLAQSAPRGPCQATVVTPGRAPMGASRAACAIDPGRFLELAERLRRPIRDPDARAEAAARDAAFEALTSRLLGDGARRAEHQAGWDAPLAVHGPTRGFTRTGGGELRSFDRNAAAIRDEPRPLVARRARGWSATVAIDGDALVRTSDGLRLVHPDGTTSRFADPLPPGPPRRDELAVAGAAFARIGRSWWTARGAPVRVVPPATSERSPGAVSHPDAAVLIGGTPHGLLLELDGAALVVSSLDAEGGMRRLGRGAAPILPPLDAAPRDGGGAIVIGRSRSAPGRLVTFAVDASGTVLPARGDLEAAVHGPVPRLAALPGAGAIVLPGRGARFAWLDGDGAVLGATTAAPVPHAGCLDGAHLPARLPGWAPGTVLDAPVLGSEGACVVGAPGWGADGVVRAVVSRRSGPHASLSLVPLASAPTPPAPPASAVQPGLRGAATSEAKTPPSPRCAPEMVLVDDRFCVDRHEAAVVESATGRLASPDYPITPNLFAGVLGDWATRREHGGDAFARLIPLPRPMPFQLEGVIAPRATSRAGILPSGYLTGLVAREICAAAGKRLCTKEEFRTACRGEKRTRFPYGDAYRTGVCNVGRDGHPAAVLHDHASLGHLDPRLGRVPLDGAPGLRPTGTHPACVSRWGDDAIHDMVGNLDEWIDVEGGAFAGGFYARRTTSGCDAIVENHPPSYLDYSTGTRCCATARGAE